MHFDFFAQGHFSPPPVLEFSTTFGCMLPTARKLLVAFAGCKVFRVKGCKPPLPHINALQNNISYCAGFCRGGSQPPADQGQL